MAYCIILITAVSLNTNSVVLQEFLRDKGIVLDRASVIKQAEVTALADCNCAEQARLQLYTSCHVSAADT